MSSTDRSRQRWAARMAPLALTGSLLLPAEGRAADLPVPSAPVPVSSAPTPAWADWHYQVTAYGWATSLTGDVGIRDRPVTSVDMPFSDVLKNLDGALMGSLFASNGPWLVLADVVLARLSHTAGSGAWGGPQLDVSLNETIASGAVGYMLPVGRPDLQFAPTVGVRYVRLKADETLSTFAIPLPLSASQTQQWFDPTVGFYAHWEPHEKWFVNAIADIGGFGVGSKLSSTGYLGVGYMWTSSFSTALGYRYLYEDYEKNSTGTGSFRYQTTMHGPTVAFAWRF